MLFKALALAAIFFIIYIVFFKKPNTTIKTKRKEKKKPQPKGDIMMECQQCQTFVSEDDAIIKDGKFYCSKQCAQLR
ncbi:PP0621 family protein [Sulfurospirillum arcachonense]|uniref:PP0621 family protein n=1 Tax=Sulfurospirillum arcachonense TaxID=57666 RepID=UPI00046984DD|nr:PP0621 family protein [Sulfurospirillum arcachonense]